MKTVFDNATREELIGRINTLGESNEALWGKMNVYQMIKHCSMFDEWILGKLQPVYKQAFIGRLLGKMVLKGLLNDENPMKRNMMTIAGFKVKETAGDFAAAKNKWIALIPEYEYFSNPGFVHTFFGRMTNSEIGFLNYKHTDHHLRQFGA